MRCDSHVHVVAAPDEYAQIAERTFLAGKAPLQTLIDNGKLWGIDHFVVTQPSFYGTDNSVLLTALDELQGRGRGVITVEPTIDDASLQNMKMRGAVGLRANLYSPAAQNVGGGSDDIRALMELAAKQGLHAEIIAPIRVLAEKADLLADSPADIVIDHYGLFGHARPEDPDGRRLLELAEQPHVWTKLSSPYRLPGHPLNTEPDRQWLSAFLDRCADRCVWGSDWPHPPPHEAHQGSDIPVPWRPLSYAGLVRRFMNAVGDRSMVQKLFTHNPVRLYGFREPVSSRFAS